MIQSLRASTSVRGLARHNGSRLIVNADDFGLTNGVNRSIEEAHRRGVLTSTSVLVTAEHAGEAAEVSRRCPELDIGLHVNLTFGRPASEPSRVPTLVGPEGTFHPDIVRRAFLRRVNAAEVFREVAAQAAELNLLGITPIHWDSHQGVSFWPVLVGPIAAATREAGIPCTRSHRAWVVDQRLSPGIARVKRRLRQPEALLTDSAQLASSRVLRRHFVMPDWRTSANFARQSGCSYVDAWERAFERLPTGVSEIVSHPAYVDGELVRLTPDLVDEREVDRVVLSDPTWTRRLDDLDVRLISFKDLLR
jgi:predicted glycoside hydrolase/deacetylase ChbG (UPF0249 family)